MAGRRHKQEELRCSFCGKEQAEVRKLVAGPEVSICNECIKICMDMLAEEFTARPKQDTDLHLFLPHEIKAYLDQYVIGQEQAKKVLSVAIYNHYKRLIAQESGPADDVEITKSNVLLLGPTGTGKTLLAQTLARLLNVPFTIADVTTLTEAGYVGEDVENIIANLLAAADGDVERTKQGIVYIDEIDKIARRSGDTPAATRDVGGEGVQQGLLKLIEGTVAMVTPHGKRGLTQVETIPIDTRNILFICGGTFQGLEEVISRRIGQKSLGFGANLKQAEKKNSGEILSHVETEDLVKFGIIPELIGRLPVIATLGNLSEHDLERILTEPKNALTKQYEALFAMENVKLTFSKKAIKAIAKKAMGHPASARALRAVIEDYMLEIMYETPFIPGLKECRIEAEVFTKREPPVLIYNNPKRQSA